MLNEPHASIGFGIHTVEVSSTEVQSSRGLEEAQIITTVTNTRDPNALGSKTLETSLEVELSEADMDESESDDVEMVIEDVQSQALETVQTTTGEGKVPVKPKLTRGKKKKLEQIERAMSNNTGGVVQTIYQDSITPVSSAVLWQHPELICCYNWQDSDDGTNTIFVPGGPPKWTSLDMPQTVAPDSGFHTVDHNYARQPLFPYAPMFHALNIMNPKAQFTNIDVLADRNNLRTLLEFCQGKTVGPFRLDLYLVGNTLILVRKEGNFWKRMLSGYGHNFEKKFSRAGTGLEDATSHYRVIRYPMGPLNVALRFEADAYYEAPSSETDEVIVQIEDVAAAAATSGNPGERPRFNFRAPINAVPRGSLVPCVKIAELKTKAYKIDKAATVECMDQLWFGRTTHLFTGVYDADSGVFSRIKYEDAMERIIKWETKSQESLQKLTNLLVMLRNMLKAERGPVRALVLVREDRTGPLLIRKMEEKRHITPMDVYFKYWQRSQGTSRPQTGNRGGRGNRGGGRDNFNTARGGGPVGRGRYAF